jgi:catechol 2,3-dioxygenase
LEQLRAAKGELEKFGIRISGMSDHTVTQSLYLHDPDDNEVELYVDAPGIDWKHDPKAVLAPIKPLNI